MLQFEDDWLQWPSVDCPFLFWGAESGKPSKTLGSPVRVEMSQALAPPLVSCVTLVRKEPLWPAAPLPHSECTGAASPTGLLEGSCDSNRHQEMLKAAARAYQFPFLQQKYQFVSFSCVDMCYIVSVSLTDKMHQDSWAIVNSESVPQETESSFMCPPSSVLPAQTCRGARHLLSGVFLALLPAPSLSFRRPCPRLQRALVGYTQRSVVRLAVRSPWRPICLGLKFSWKGTWSPAALSTSGGLEELLFG